MPNKSAHYQNARLSTATSFSPLSELFFCIEQHSALTLISREEVYSKYLQQARKDGQGVTAARISAASEMLRLLDLIAANVPD